MYENLKERAKEQEEAFNRLVKIVEILRSECPWDKEQTHESLRGCIIEEAYEVAEAIDNKDNFNLREELGDVLLQVIFHSSLAHEKGIYSIKDVINDECEKMIRRHPHIFSKENAETVDKVLEKWENIKLREHGDTSIAKQLEGVPKALPALMRARKVQKKAAQVGFDHENITVAICKIAEETEELVEAYHFSDRQKIIKELGNLLFSVVNIARFLDVEPERALEVAIDKFINRFNLMEEKILATGGSVEGTSLEEMNTIWEEVKV